MLAVNCSCRVAFTCWQFLFKDYITFSNQVLKLCSNLRQWSPITARLAVKFCTKKIMSPFLIIISSLFRMLKFSSLDSACFKVRRRCPPEQWGFEHSAQTRQRFPLSQQSAQKYLQISLCQEHLTSTSILLLFAMLCIDPLRVICMLSPPLESPRGVFMNLGCALVDMNLSVTNSSSSAEDCGTSMRCLRSQKTVFLEQVVQTI